MNDGTATIRRKLQIYVKPEEQAYDVYIDSYKVSTYSYEYRHKGALTSSVSPDYPPVGEVKYTSFSISTASGPGIYKAGFDNLRSYGGMPDNAISDVAELYLSPTGSDTNPGTQSKPLRTLERARDITRNFNTYMTHDITVYMAQGDYYTSNTFNLSDKDSGTNGYRIIYKNKDAGGSARIIGGKNLNGWTQVIGTSMYKVKVGTGLTISNIYENEKLGRVARYPNYKEDKDYQSNFGNYLISQSGDPDGYFLKYYANDLNPSGWTKFAWPTSAKIVWWCYGGTPDWGMDYRQISSIDSSIDERKINFATPFTSVVSDGTKAKDRFYIEGIYELLDAPGELYYDEPNGDLYYWPMDGNPSSSTILLPQATGIINVTGSAIGKHVQNITFDGLYLYGSKFIISTGSGAGINLRHTKNIDIKNCHFKNIGGMGINVYEDNEYINIYGCWIEHVGTGGICVYNPLSRTNYPDAKSRYNTISNCKIQNYTDLSITATLSAGVTLYDTSNCEVSYSEIFNGGRYAISLRGNVSQFDPVDTGMHYAKDNTFKYLKLYHCGTDSGDMGTLHAAMVNATNGSNINNWNQITIDNTSALPSMQDYKPNGIFLDHQHCCENQNFSNIKITNSQGWDYRTNVNPIQTTSNVSWTGTFVDANMQYTTIGLKSDFPSVYGTSTTATPAPEPVTLPGEIVIDNSDVGYSETGTGWVNSTVGGMKGGSGRYNATKVSTATAVWTPTIAYAGLYDVYVWKFGADPTNGNAAAKFYVNTNGQKVLYAINQKSVANRWEKLGAHYFAAGTLGNVTLACDLPSLVDTGITRADAVKFVPVLLSVDKVIQAPYLTNTLNQVTTNTNEATKVNVNMWTDKPVFLIFATYNNKKLIDIKIFPIGTAIMPQTYSFDISSMQKNGYSAKAFIQYEYDMTTPFYPYTSY